MTYNEGVRLASRLIAAYLLLWALGDLIAIPREVASIVRDLRVAAYDGRYAGTLMQSSLGFLIANVLKVAVWCLLAGYFYRCGPGVRKFFGAVHEE